MDKKTAIIYLKAQIKFFEKDRNYVCFFVKVTHLKLVGNRGAIKMKQILDGRSDPLKKTKSDILQLNVTNSVLADNKEHDSDFKGIDCTSENNYLLKNRCYDNITDNRIGSLEGRNTEHIQRRYQVQKIIMANLLKMFKRLESVL